MNQIDRQNRERHMKMAQLCDESGLTRSSIHHYMNIGLLHRPKKAGLNLSLYDESHLARLRHIRRMREEGKSLTEIGKILDSGGIPAAQPTETAARESLRDPEKHREEGNPRRETQKNREKILDAAIELFSKKGYENTKISDITDALHMGKGTFYIYFKNKEELFLECIDRLTVIIVPKEAWEDIRSERDYGRRIHKRGVAFLKAFPGFRGILNMLRVALGSDDPRLVQKARDTFRILSRPMIKDLRRAIADGVVRAEIDEEFVGYLHLVLAEGLGYWQMIDPRYTHEEGMELLNDLFVNGFLTQTTDMRETHAPPACPGEVVDQKGVTTALESVRVADKPCLPGNMGEAEIEVEFEKVSRVDIRRQDTTLLAYVTMQDGQELGVAVDGELTLSGNASFGSFHLPLKHVSRISFREE